jgi:uncharacterized protein YjbJ (UPF0337 family)
LKATLGRALAACVALCLAGTRPGRGPTEERSRMGAKADRAKGRVKEGVGGVTDNKRLKDKGRADSAAGTAKKAAGRATDKVKRVLD